MRVIERVINMGMWNSQGTFEGETQENLVRQLNAVASWTTQYQKARSMYVAGSHMARQSADIVIDGMKSVEEIAADTLNEIKDRQRAAEI